MNEPSTLLSLSITTIALFFIFSSLSRPMLSASNDPSMEILEGPDSSVVAP